MRPNRAPPRTQAPVPGPSREPVEITFDHVRLEQPPQPARAAPPCGGRPSASAVSPSSLVALGLWWYANSKLEEIDVPSLEEERTAGEDEGVGELEDTLNVLVVGNDTREGLTEAQLQELGTEDDGSQLTDTIMVVQIAPSREKAVVVAFPRDLRVPG